MAWYRDTGHAHLDKATVQAYKAKLQADGLASSTINLKLSAARKLAHKGSGKLSEQWRDPSYGPRRTSGR